MNIFYIGSDVFLDAQLPGLSRERTAYFGCVHFATAEIIIRLIDCKWQKSTWRIAQQRSNDTVQHHRLSAIRRGHFELSRTVLCITKSIWHSLCTRLREV